MKLLGLQYPTEDLKKLTALGLTALTGTGLYYLYSHYTQESSSELDKPENQDKSPLPTPEGRSKSWGRKSSFKEFNLERKSKTECDPTEKEAHKDFMTKARMKPCKTMNKRQSKNKIFLFAVTGGPCAGKTTSLQYLSERFTPKFKVYVIPEMASLTCQAGVSILPEKFTPTTHTSKI